ncbi:hypothetical protein [Streptomyces sp. A30]|uniref:hypothetical protein n=1 Tax=Streptomyces sp. A30 TaxID=2789273 RepID=UPI0039812928
MATTPRIREVASVEVKQLPQRYEGYHEDLIEVLDLIARQQDHMTTSRQRQELIAKRVEKVGSMAASLGGGSSE